MSGTSNPEREELIQSFLDRGKTREQAEAFLDILGSGMRRRGWVEGEPLSYNEIAERLDTMVGGPAAQDAQEETT